MLFDLITVMFAEENRRIMTLRPVCLELTIGYAAVEHKKEINTSFLSTVKP
jgi:hypothetical protein